MTSTLIAGRRLRLRLLERGGADLIRRFYGRLSSETIYRRFLSPITLPNEALVRRLVDIDHHDRDALIALDEDGIAKNLPEHSPAGGRSVDRARLEGVLQDLIAARQLLDSALKDG